MKRYGWLCIIVLAAGFGIWVGGLRSTPAPAADDLRAQVATLQAQVKKLEGLVPDQAAVMMKVGYHFTNLYIAVQKENWPLADFYLGETVNNIKWAVRAKPNRKDPQGREIDLGGIAQALEGTQFKELKLAIAARDQGRVEKAYEQTLDGCYACHTTSGKPYLRPQKPVEQEVKIINFNPTAVP